MNKQKKFFIYLSLAVVAVIGGVFFNRTDVEKTKNTNEIKDLNSYTWEEYQMMSFEEREEFFLKFETLEAFELWKKSSNSDENIIVDIQWDKHGKNPDEYTWEEYLNLNLEEKDAFYHWFDSKQEFELWIEKTKPKEKTEISKWNKSGKLPNEYTWKEYQLLEAEEKDAFYNWFNSKDDFGEWKNSVISAEKEKEIQEWNKMGKEPNEYTWQEYQLLNSEEQEIFYHWFGSIDAFEDWMNDVKPSEEETTVVNWNKQGKKPYEYTWKEYSSLKPEEQEAFYQWFETIDEFEAWMNDANPQENEFTVIEWNKSGKKPDKYTWKEYQALSVEDQESFYQWFGSIDYFEEWMKSVKPENDELIDITWNKSGKKPDEYTREEYQSLNALEQEAFYNWFGSKESFEEWLNNSEKK